MDDTYTTARGVTVRFLSIAPHLEKLRLARRAVEVPTYAVTSRLTGVTEQVPLDGKVLAEHPEQFTPEQHEQWREYERRRDAEEREYQMRVTRLMFLYGLSFEEQDGWVERQQALGFIIPTDPAERRIHYIETEVLGTFDDYHAITLGVMRASGATDDLLAQVAASFRSQAQRDTAARIADSDESVDDNTQIRRGTRGMASQDDNEPVGRAKRRGQSIRTRDNANARDDASV